ncbi:MAG TPA: GNAT family N-acetyltransferase [Puia sp.]|nr:GNAT family N-acetyltransferase [Puia sp.]
MSPVFSHVEPIFPVRDIPETIRYWREVLGFTHHWTWGEPPGHGGVSWQKAFVQFQRDPDLAALSKGNGIWIRLRHIEELYALHRRNKAEIVAPLELQDYGLAQYSVREINGYYVHFAGEPAGRGRHDGGGSVGTGQERGADRPGEVDNGAEEGGGPAGRHDETGGTFDEQARETAGGGPVEVGGEAGTGSSGAEMKTKKVEHAVRIVERRPTIVEYQQLQASIWDGPGEDHAIGSVVGTADLTVVAEDAVTREVVGCALMLSDHAGFYCVKNVMVRRNWQGRGVGTALMKELMQRLESRVAGPALVGLFARESLEPFYQQFGFLSSFGMVKEIGGAK